MKISTKRWRGRLDASFSYLRHKGITIHPDDTYNGILCKVKLSESFSDLDKRAFANLVANSFVKTGDSSTSQDTAMGRMDYEYVRKHYPNEVFPKLVEETDYASKHMLELRQEQEKSKKRIKKTFKIALPIVAIIIIGIVVYNLPYFAEKRAYSSTINMPSRETFETYIANYSNPEHLPDVLYRQGLYYLTAKEETQYANISDSLLARFPEAQLSWAANSESGERQCIKAWDSLLTRFPEHELSRAANEKIDSIWNCELARFIEKHPDPTSSSSLAAMYEMLEYMKENRIYDILLIPTSDVDLKEYDDFPSGVRDFLEFFHPELKSNPVLKIKDYFQQSDQYTLEQMLTVGFKKSINEFFTPNFFSVIVKSNNDEDSSKLPVINLGYSIKSQIDKLGDHDIPIIWTYVSKSSDGTEQESKHIMGIEVAFASSLSFPGQNTPWTVKIKGSPEEDIHNIQNIEDGYRLMTRKCFEKFGEKLITLLGLE